MEKQKFEAMLMLLVPQVVHLITENYSYDELSATKEFYNSKVYSVLEQEDTKLWHLSALTLFHMFDEEKNGYIYIPGGGVIMSKEGNFLIYCTEQYKSAKNLTGRQVSELFTKYRAWDYIYSCFEALHTTGEKYIVEDIDLYIEARQWA